MFAFYLTARNPSIVQHELSLDSILEHFSGPALCGRGMGYPWDPTALHLPPLKDVLSCPKLLYSFTFNFLKVFLQLLLDFVLPPFAPNLFTIGLYGCYSSKCFLHVQSNFFLVLIFFCPLHRIYFYSKFFGAWGILIL